MKRLDGREDQNPWSKWFWADYEADTGLRASSLCAQGLWMRMLGIMARSKKRGFLLDGEKQMKSKILAKLVGEGEAVVDGLIAELEDHDVPSRTEDGTLYNRRMVREARLSEIRSHAGRQGGRPKSKTKANPKQRVKARSASASASASAYASASLKEQRKKGKSKKGGGGSAGRSDDSVGAAMDKDGLLPIPAVKDVGFGVRDELVKIKAEIRADLRDLAGGKSWTSREKVEKRIAEFNQRVRDLSDG